MNRSLVLGSTAGLLVALLAAVFPDLGGLERLAGDALARSVAQRLTPSPEVLLVTVDDSSLRTLEPEFGRWPFDRELMARVVEEAAIGGAKAVGFDVLFAGENRQAGAGDARFAAAMSSMPVVLAAQTNRTDAPSQSAAAWPREGPPPERLYALTRRPWEGFEPSSGMGTIRLSENAPSYPIADPLSQDQAIPSLALATATAARKWNPSVVLQRNSVQIGDTLIPAREGEMLLRWKDHDPEAPARQRGNRTLPWQVVNLERVVIASFAREDPSMGVPADQLEAFSTQFRDKVVLVGFTAAGLINDLRTTPLSPATPGLEIHATALENILTRDFNRHLPRGVGFLLPLLAGVVTGTLLTRRRSRLLASLMILLLALAAAAGAWLALTAGFVVPLAAPLLALALAWGVITLVDYIAERRRSATLKATFGRYVSPQVLDYLLAHPERVELGGQRRDMTILFSDIRGFTTISEASEPEEVVEMLNEYLSRMVEILLSHEGTLDKFIGDAVMGFWNAPADVDDHPTRAVRCAIEMIEETRRLELDWRSRGKPAIRIGIGIHSGEAVVGNIGSERVFGYTVIGDTVNLASRLESKNKDYGTEIIISEATLDRLTETFDVTYLDEVNVKGKTKAVRIYQVRGRS